MKSHIKDYKDLSRDEVYKILKLRQDVFVFEQACPYQDIDGLDDKAVHIYIEEDGEVLAYARIIDCFSMDNCLAIGRVLVKKDQRSKGLGAKVMKEAIGEVERLIPEGRVYIEAQVYAKDFYKKLGFKEISEPFDLDGIAHVKMVLDLSK